MPSTTNHCVRLLAWLITPMALLAATVAAALVPQVAHAQATWSGTGANTTWSTTGNWSTALANGFNTGLVFRGSSGLTNSNDLTSGTATSITFDSSAGAFVIGGNAITLTGGITNNSTSTQTINLNMTTTAQRTITFGAGAGSLVLGGTISGAGGGLTWSSGTVTLTGNNAFSGTTFVRSRININSDTAVGTSLLSMNGSSAAFDNTSGTDRTIANNILLTNNPIFVGTGNLTTTGTVSSSIQQTFYVNGSTLTVGVLNLTTGGFEKRGTGTLALTGAAPGPSGGSLVLTVGTLVLGNDNSLRGPLRLNAGTLQASADVMVGTEMSVSLSANSTVGGTSSISIAGTLTNQGFRLTNSIAAGKSLTFSGTTFLQESGTGVGRILTLAGTGNTVFSGAIVNGGTAGNSGLTITNTGTTTLSGVNTYTGNTVLSGSGGRFAIGNAGQLLGTTGTYAGTITGTNVTFEYASSADSILSGAISGTTALVKSGAGTLTLLAPNTYVGTTTLSGGVINLGSAETAGTSGPLGKSAAANAGSIVLSGGTLQYSDNNFNDYSGRFSTADGAQYNVDTNGQSVTWATALTSNGGSFRKLGSGTLTLSGNNSYSGGATVNEGQLTLAHAAALGTGTATVAGGSLDIANYTPSVVGFTITSGSLVGTGTLTATNGYALNGGTVSANLGTGTLTVTANALLNGVSGATAINLNSGTLWLGGASRFTTGNVAVTGSSGAAVSLGGSESFGSLAGAANVALGSGTLSVGSANTSTSFSGVISGVGGLIKAGSGALTLTGNNTYSGLTTISGGTLSVGDGGSSGALAGNVVNNAALIFNRSDEMTYAGNMSGSGGLEKLGVGKLTLTGSHSFAGVATVSAGTLTMNGQFAGSVAVATGATLGGSGVIDGLLSGSGIVSPGNSPGILTSGQFDPSGGLGAAFEFTGLTPTYNTPTASVNDVLRLTYGTPFTDSLSIGNVIDIYFNMGSVGDGVYEGGFFTGLSSGDLFTALQNATVNYWIKDSGGTREFNGVTYSPYSGVTLSTATVTRDFGDGNVTGSVTQFAIVPEPGSLALAGIGAGLAGWTLWKRRSIVRIANK